MSDVFIGTDIISIPRLKKTINSSHGDKFTNRIFTENEIDYCRNKVNSIIHFAGRFAAKEAITKALLSSEIIDSISMKSIEIISGKNRKPEVNLTLSSKLQIQCKVSISHTDEYAIAFALLEIL
ncbi:MAG: holo-ACP synthase [Candidatus Marinimicrobia bacterium]|nr:holo-ACP synthase [Candidatus Neomarinimicrobiota bacterium]